MLLVCQHALPRFYPDDHARKVGNRLSRCHLSAVLLIPLSRSAIPGDQNDWRTVHSRPGQHDEADESILLQGSKSLGANEHNSFRAFSPACHTAASAATGRNKSDTGGHRSTRLRARLRSAQNGHFTGTDDHARHTNERAAKTDAERRALRERPVSQAPVTGVAEAGQNDHCQANIEDRRDPTQGQRSEGSARCHSFATCLQPQSLKPRRLLLPFPACMSEAELAH